MTVTHGWELVWADEVVFAFEVFFEGFEMLFGAGALRSPMVGDGVMVEAVFGSSDVFDLVGVVGVGVSFGTGVRHFGPVVDGEFADHCRRVLKV